LGIFSHIFLEVLEVSRKSEAASSDPTLVSYESDFTLFTDFSLVELSKKKYFKGS